MAFIAWLKKSTMRQRAIGVGVIAASFLFFGPPSSEACTLWAAAGTSVEGGGVLVAKNRDWAPDHRQELAILRPAEGFAAIALRAVGGEEPGIKAGVNEKGLVIVAATAGQVARADRKKVQYKKGLIRHYLATCASVDDVLKNTDLMGRPVFYLVGDRQEIAIIEVGPDGRRSVTRKDAGTLQHTNHYCVLDPRDLKKPNPSSRQRLARIEDLLHRQAHPLSVEDFIRFSTDRDAGPDNSIWRTGSGSDRHRTLATWVVSAPPAGSPLLYVRIANPGEAERACRLSVAEALRLKGGDHIPLDAALCGNSP